MIKRAKKHLTITFKESFVPVILVVIALSAVLIYVNFKAVLNSDRVVTIKILDNYVASGMDDLEGVAEDELVQFSHSQSDDPLYQKAAQAIERQSWLEAEKIYQRILAKQATSQEASGLSTILINLTTLNFHFSTSKFRIRR